MIQTITGLKYDFRNGQVITESKMTDLIDTLKDWELVDYFNINQPTRFVRFPRSGVFETGVEYKIDFNNWSVASSGHIPSLRVATGEAIISGLNYQRAGTNFISNSSSLRVLQNPSSTLVIVCGFPTSPQFNGYGEIKFVPTSQISKYPSFEISSTYLSGDFFSKYNGGGILQVTGESIKYLNLFSRNEFTEATLADTINGNFKLSKRDLI